MGSNRQKAQDRKDRKQDKVERGNKQILKDKSSANDWTLDWFHPKGLQLDCVDSFNKNLFTIIDAPSGCGKTSIALWLCLNQLKNRNYDQLVFIKNPTESGDDPIGFLSGDEQNKLEAHMDTTKRIFHGFMSKNKLENDTANDKIRLTIPNFLLGTTFDNCLVIMDEVQTMSPQTVKLLLERCGKYSKYIILGDSNQRYSVKKRADGFNDLVEKCTGDHQGIRFSKYEPKVGYVKMTREDNQRSDGSKFINKLYEV